MNILRKFFGVPDSSTVWPSDALPTLESVISEIEDSLSTLPFVDRFKRVDLHILDFVNGLDKRDRFTILGSDEAAFEDRIAVYDSALTAVAYANFISYDPKSFRATYEFVTNSIWSPLDEDAEFRWTMQREATRHYLMETGNAPEEWMKGL